MKSLILVGADKGGVGKTTVARLLLDYLAARLNGFRVFDGQAPGGSLKRFYPEAEIVDFHSTGGRMRVLDGLGDRPTLIDLPAGLLSQTLMLLHDSGLLEDADKGRLHLSVIHVFGPSVDSLGEATDVAARLAEGGDHYFVLNSVNDDAFASFDLLSNANSVARLGPKGVASVGHLDSGVREAADVAGGGFTQFIADETKSMLLRRLALKWQGDSFKSLDGAGFRALAVG